jgi:hypothetical protein
VSGAYDFGRTGGVKFIDVDELLTPEPSEAIERVRRSDGEVTVVATLHYEPKPVPWTVYMVDPATWARAMLEQSPASLNAQIQCERYDTREAVRAAGWSPEEVGVLR